MQSLLIPQLAGQIYAMAGMRTELIWRPAAQAAFRGENTQFNGKGFQNEKFAVVAMSPADYMRWLARVRAPATRSAAQPWTSSPPNPSRRIRYSTRACPPGLFQHMMPPARAEAKQ